MRLLAVLWLLLPLLPDAALSCQSSAHCFDSAVGSWFKGNTHAHSILMLRGVIPHGDSGPVAVARWYRDNGYDFLAITDHNRLNDPASPRFDDVHSADFLLIPGVELTSDYRLLGMSKEGKHTVHSTALNVSRLPSADFEHGPRSAILQSHLDRTAQAGGIAIVNHPNYRRQLVLDDLLALDDLRLIELHNAHPSAKNHAGAERLSTEQIWDALLGAGRRVYGIAADDAHNFKLLDWFTHGRKNFALPGSAWVMVNAPRLERDTIVEALAEGRFYSTTGVLLDRVHFDQHVYSLTVDLYGTMSSLTSPLVTEGAPVVDSGPEGMLIEFIGTDGTVLAAKHGNSASLALSPGYGYVRARATLTVGMQTRLDEVPVLRQFRAWTQPVFIDDTPKFTRLGPFETGY